MARPLKEGYEYFSIDVDFLNDKKVKLLNAEFGDKCIKTILALFSRVYKEKGYYATVDDDDYLLMSQGVLGGQSPQYISEVVQGCVKRSLFDERVFHAFGVLTSVGIQRRYLQMAQRRTTIPMYEEYLLLDLKNDEQIGEDVLNKVVLKSVLSPKTGGFRNENPSFGNENHTKVKESKVKQRKVKDGDPSAAPPDTAPTKTSAPRFVPPTRDEVRAYCIERKNNVDADRFFDYYTANGWMVGKNKMKDWRAAVRTWEKNAYAQARPAAETTPPKSTDLDDLF